jgi:DNA-binding NarL/FixJ family response regulator
MIRTLIVDDDALVRAGLRLMLAGAPDIEVVGEVADGSLVADAVAEHRPDVVLMDIRMPVMDGIAATRALRGGTQTSAQPGEPAGADAVPAVEAPQVIVLTTFGGDETILGALQAGASGYLLKHTPPEEIVDAVRRTAHGDPVLSPDVMKVLIDRATAESAPGAAAAAPVGSSRADQAVARLSVLSNRERDVASAVAQGLSNTEIAEQMYLSMGTVKSHISSALTKLDFTNRIQLALLAYEAER